MELFEQFEAMYNENITRPGAAELLRWIKSNTDFYTAPASTRFHLASEGGLLRHSLNVAEQILKFEDEPRESLVICGLLHDLCKVNYYKTSTRNVKNEQTGQWEQRPFYTIDDSFPYGHGEKSVFLIERFMRLKTSEAIAIRWHMGGYDDAVRGGSYSASKAYERYPLAVKLHIADVISTFLIETRQEDEQG